MKIRSVYVSNSSSASFVVYNWFDLPQQIRYMIKNYDKNALNVWKANNIEFRIYDNGWSKEKPFCGSEYYICRNERDELNFGYLNDSSRYTFEENKRRNTCTISAFMDNFDMRQWLKYNNVDFDELACF